ncbi:hypothetical protein JSQ81_08650 [Sporosarcina sp. Marseille-Q4063]|uniref:hypothetical protein n=1 Tax=Sporosarcina sp. Marseille-Q4063 TaxID=2810514 RepID=UPI001BAF69D0|nr:hypothetical protein [Sporosarcina sp. Marseille-Q4063]QUW23554.1 hypothetical protein JSQ81_08650 [Sporosarcina sp. Marseille-Q4063]
MSLFFEDEIQKVKKKTDRQGLENLMSQDPRNKPGWSNRNRNTSSRRDQYDAKNYMEGWWINEQ